jgi:sulfite reductase (NADPH) flavoprotein alpha-component
MSLIRIAYATQTGNAESCGRYVLAEAEMRGLRSAATNLVDYACEQILRESTLLLIASTWGDGEPPDDAMDFYEYLGKLPGQPLLQLQFAVLALGDVSYENFCQCGKDFDRMLEEKGGTRMLPRVDCDVDYETPLRGWTLDVLTALAAKELAS